MDNYYLLYKVMRRANVTVAYLFTAKLFMNSPLVQDRNNFFIYQIINHEQDWKNRQSGKGTSKDASNKSPIISPLYI